MLHCQMGCLEESEMPSPVGQACVRLTAAKAQRTSGAQKPRGIWGPLALSFEKNFNSPQ